MKINKFLLFLFILNSCSVGPDYQRPQNLTDEQLFTATGATKNTQQTGKDWYKNFSDPTLDKLISTGLADNLSIKIASSRLKQARANLLINGVKYFPNISVAGAYNYSDSSKNMPIGDETYYQAGIDVSWEIDLWGAGRRLTEAQKAFYRAAASNVYATQLAVVSEIMMAYINLRTVQENIKVAETNLKIQDKIYRLVKQRYMSQLEDKLALEQAALALEQTKSLIPSLYEKENVLKSSLSILLGLTPGSLDKELSFDKKNIVRKQILIDNSIFSMPIETIRNRPDVKYAEENLIAQNALVGRAIAQLFPNIGLSSFFGFQSLDFNNLISGNSQMAHFSPSINMPIFYWGSLINNVKLQKYLKDEALLNYQNILLSSSSEIKNAIQSVKSEYEKNSYLLQGYINSLNILRLTFSKYKNGLVNFSEVLNSEQQLLQSQTSFVNSNGQLLQNIVSFYKSIGGGYA